MKYRRVLLFFSSLFFICVNMSYLKAQVTIGSDIAPNKGALLDLKEGANTTKGLGMPRVQLTNLNPTTPTELAQSIGGTGSWTLADHTALAVYNVKANHCALPEAIYEGLYVFDGGKWELLGQSSVAPGVHTFTDSRNGETYRYREFYYMAGATKISAGEWMLENLRYIPNNADAGFTGFTHSAATITIPYTDKYWCYPWKGNTTYNAAQAQADWDKRAGILYNWPAATNGRTTTGNPLEGQGNPDAAAAIGIQGICPSGWHIPTDEEWNELERAIYNNASLYSQYKNDGSDAFTPTTWQDNNTLNWETGYVNPSPPFGWRGSSAKGHGIAMLSECLLPGHGYGTPGGKSLSSVKGGFEAHLAGHGKAGNVTLYGSGGFIWSASAHGSGDAWLRSFSVGNPQVYRFVTNRHYLYSVRCKKN